MFLLLSGVAHKNFIEIRSELLGFSCCNSHTCRLISQLYPALLLRINFNYLADYQQIMCLLLTTMRRLQLVQYWGTCRSSQNVVEVTRRIASTLVTLWKKHTAGQPTSVVEMSCPARDVALSFWNTSRCMHFLNLSAAKTGCRIGGTDQTSNFLFILASG